MARAYGKDASGFTMIELVIVLSILSICAALGYSGWMKYRIQSAALDAANQFVQDLRYAREQAMIRSVTVSIEWDQTGYRIKANDGTVLASEDLRRKYGKFLRMQPSGTPSPCRVSFDYRGLRLDGDAATNIGPLFQVSFGTEKTIRRVQILPTGFCRVLKGG